jgi:hypothetical protein
MMKSRAACCGSSASRAAARPMVLTWRCAVDVTPPGAAAVGCSHRRLRPRKELFQSSCCTLTGLRLKRRENGERMPDKQVAYTVMTKLRNLCCSPQYILNSLQIRSSPQARRPQAASSSFAALCALRQAALTVWLSLKL